MITLSGYAAGLDAAHESVSPGAVVVGPGGFAYATPQRLAGDPPWLSAVTGNRLSCREIRPVENRVAAHHGVGCVRLVGPAAGADHPFRTEPLRHHLLRAHTRLLAETVELAVADLGTRSAAGSPLLGRQLVQAGIADATMLAEEITGQLDADVLNPAMFARLVRGGRALLRLLGAASFLTGGPGGALLTAEQVGTLYLGQAAHHD